MVTMRNTKKTKIKTNNDRVITNFCGKKYQKKSSMQVFISNNARFYYRGKQKVLSSSTFEGMQIWTKKDKNENLINYDLEKSESDSDFDNETESDIDNGESDE